LPEKLRYKSSKQPKHHRPNMTGRGGASRAEAEARVHAHTRSLLAHLPILTLL
jgi:hypothetical protein